MKSTLFVDKTLENIFFIDIIKEIFPLSKIIVCERDYFDSFVAIFQQCLQGLSWAHKKSSISQYIQNFDNFVKKIKKQKIKNNKKTKTKLLKDGDVTSINWKSELLVIYIWDKNIEDGDKINLSINDERILSNYLTKNKKRKLEYKLMKGINNIYIEAINNGDTPPNTTSVELEDLKTKYPITTQLKTGNSVIIKIIK